MRTIRRVLTDLKNLRNVDAYVVGGIGIALIFLDVIGNVELDAYLSVMTAALVVMLFRTTTPTKKLNATFRLARNAISAGFSTNFRSVKVSGPLSLTFSM